MLFSRDKIRDYVNSLHISDDVTLQEVKYFSDPKNKDKLQDTGIQLIVLAAKSPGSAVLSKPSNFNSNKKFAAYNKQYHRYFLCADASNPPHCFGVVTQTMAQTHQLLSNTVDESFLGLSYYLVEPDISTSKLGKYLPVLTCDDDELMPLKPGAASDLLRPSPIELPSGPDETFYFVLKNMKVKFFRIKAPHDVSCTGFQCDRQKKKGECVCIQFNPGFPLVYSYDIQFDVDPKVMNGETKHVSTFRSLRTTGVFYRNFAEYSATTTYEREKNMQVKRRKQIQEMSEYISDHGGWTIIGWCKRGQVSVEGESEKVENNEINLNLSYVYPSDLNIFSDKEFSKLRIYDDFSELSAASPAPRAAAGSAASAAPAAAPGDGDAEAVGQTAPSGSRRKRQN